MAQLIRQGENLSDSMLSQGAYFPNLLVRLVRAGEHSGSLDKCFRELYGHYRELRSARSAFVGQITFPLISLLLAFFVITLLIYINGFMRSGDPNEPAFDLTGVGLRGGSGVAIFWSLAFSLASISGIIAFGIWKNWFQCHKTLVPLIRNIPVVGPVFTTSALSRLSMTLSMMLGAGVDAKRSVREALLATGNYYYISGVKQTVDLIEHGSSFSEALDAPKTLPAEFIQVVEVGELSGSDSESLEKLAETYKEKSQLALKQFAVASGMAVWLMIAGIIIFAIFTIFFQIMQAYSKALSM